MNTALQTKVVTSAVGLSLLLPALCWLFFVHEAPSALYPFPALVFIPALLGLRQAAVVVPVVGFFTWNPGLVGGDSVLPRRSSILLLAATLLNVLWFIVGWKDGVSMQGLRYTYWVSAVNAVWIALLWMLFAKMRKAGPSFKVNLLFHWMLFAWIAWYAFPFFGELP
jgi:hypothetical protein